MTNRVEKGPQTTEAERIRELLEYRKEMFRRIQDVISVAGEEEIYRDKTSRVMRSKPIPLCTSTDEQGEKILIARVNIREYDESRYFKPDLLQRIAQTVKGFQHFQFEIITSWEKETGSVVIPDVTPEQWFVSYGLYGERSTYSYPNGNINALSEEEFVEAYRYDLPQLENLVNVEPALQDIERAVRLRS